MKDILYFYLQNCPYCVMADRMLKEIIDCNPVYEKLTITRIEERQNREMADRYEYYYVPCFWVDGKKLFEGIPTQEDIRAVLDTALCL